MALFVISKPATAVTMVVLALSKWGRARQWVAFAFRISTQTLAFTTDNQNGEPGDIRLNITNGTGSTIDFDFVLFDFLAQGSDTSSTHEDYSVVFENTTTLITSGVLGSGSATLGSGSGGYTDVDINASSVSLGDGESGRFIITLSGADPTSSSSAILDNFAVTGTLVPEPGSMALVGLSGLLLLARRRRV